MLTLLALLISAPSVPGCRNIGASLHCELEAPVRPAPPVATPPPTTIARAHRRRASHHRRHAARSVSATNPTPPTDADIQSHIDTLTTIGDCSGVRTYAASMRPASADAAYRACVGGDAPAAPPRPPTLPPAPIWVAPPGQP